MSQMRKVSYMMKKAKVAVILIMLPAATSAGTQAQVFVPGNASGLLGNPADHGGAVGASPHGERAGEHTFAYVSGVAIDGGGNNIGPTGVRWNTGGAQSPLQGTKGVSGGTIYNLNALIGVSVPAPTANRTAMVSTESCCRWYCSLSWPTPQGAVPRSPTGPTNRIRLQRAQQIAVKPYPGRPV